MTDFYTLSATLTEPCWTEWEAVEDLAPGPAPTCPECDNFLGMLTAPVPLRVRLRGGGPHLGDLVFGPGDLLVVSEKFVACWTAASLSPLAGVVPVEVASIKPRGLAKTAGRFFSLTAPRPGVRVDFLRSGVPSEQITCSTCGGTNLGLKVGKVVVDEGTWNGEDLFIPDGFNQPTVSERAAAVIRASGLRNVSLEQLGRTS